MANPNFASHGTLVANTVATVTLNKGAGYVTVVNRSGSAEIYFTVAVGTNTPVAPTVGGSDTYVLPAAIGSVRVPAAFGTVAVSLISTGTPTYSVESIAP